MLVLVQGRSVKGSNRRRPVFLGASRPRLAFTILVLVWVGQSSGQAVGGRSFSARQGLFWPYYASFSVGAVSQGVKPETSLFGRVKASLNFVLPYPTVVLVYGGGQSRVNLRSPLFSTFARSR